MKMANKGKKPIRQTNTANHPQRSPNYNHNNNNNYTMKPISNINRNMDMNNNRQYRINNNDMGINMMNEYPSNNSHILPRQNNQQYNQIKSTENRKPITANEYNRNHNYNNNKNNYQANKAPRRLNNGYNNNNFNNNYNNNNNFNNNNYNNNNYKNNNYNNYNYKNNLNNYNNNNNDDDNRPIGGGLTADQMPDENSATSPCPHCGRSFNQNAFSKHVKICEKVFLKKRKAFNTQKQRINDSEQASLMKQGALEAKTNPMLNQNKKQGEIPKWKLQSMAFRAICNPGKNNPPMNNNMTMKNNKNAVANYKNYRGGMNNNNNNQNMMGNNNMNVGGYVSTAVAYGYKHCEYCNRNYNEEAYNKHLNFCKRKFEDNKIKNRGKKQGANSNVSNNLAKKNQYGNALANTIKLNNGKYNKKK